MGWNERCHYCSAKFQDSFADFKICKICGSVSVKNGNERLQTQPKKRKLDENELPLGSNHKVPKVQILICFACDISFESKDENQYQRKKSDDTFRAELFREGLFLEKKVFGFNKAKRSQKYAFKNCN